MCKNLNLYPHTEDIYKTWVNMSKIEKDILIILGCGLGKTGIAAKIIQNHFINKPILYVLPTNSIEKDILNKDFWEFPNVKFIMYHSLKKVNPDDYALCIFDEGHHIAAPTWIKYFNRFKESTCHTITMTATDCRMDGVMLRRDMFNENNTIIGMSMFDAISLGKIKKPKYISSLLNPTESRENVLTYARKQQTSSDNMKILADSFQNIMKFDEILKKYAYNKHRILAYVPKIESVDEYYDKITEIFPNALIFKIHNKINRKDIFEALNIFNSDINKQVILISINILNEGIHPKDIDCLLLLRDTSSIIMYMQQIGRIVDLNKPDKDTMIIDLVATHERSRYMKTQALLNSPDNKSSHKVINGLDNIRTIKEKMFDIVGDHYVDILNVIQSNINILTWTADMVATLGTMPDGDVASKYGISINSVSHKRRMLGIPPYKKIDWTDEMIADLGVLSDPDVAEKYGISTHNVCRQRRKLNISQCGNPQRIYWTNEMISDLGKISDADVAIKWNISKQAVTKKRMSLKIPPYKKIHWTDEMISDLGKISDADVAIKWNMSRQSVRKQRISLKIPSYVRTYWRIQWTNEMISDFYKFNNRIIAEKYGINLSTVVNKRKELNIPLPVHRRWDAKHVELLGSMSDSELGKLIGRSTASVRRKRNLLGIAPYNLNKSHKMDMKG